MAFIAGGGGGGGSASGAGVFKKKGGVKAPSPGPTLPKYTNPYGGGAKPLVKPKGGGGKAKSGGGYGGGGSKGKGSSGYAGGGSVGSTSGGSVSYGKPAKPPSLASFLGTDSTYVQQKSALEKAKADYLAQQGKSRTNYETGYAVDLDTLKNNRVAAMADLENDFAGRGLMNSGLYADSQATANNDWDKRGSALEQAKAQFLEGLSGDFANFSEEQLLTLQRAEQEAAARRASKYGV